MGRFLSGERLYNFPNNQLDVATVATLRNADDDLYADVVVTNSITGETLALARQLLTVITPRHSPEITPLENGGFKIDTSSLNVSRSYFDQTLTFAYRDGAFILAGITCSEFDRMHAAEFKCDHNLLTGKFEWTATVSAEQTKDRFSDSGNGKIAQQKLELANLSQDDFPTDCASLSKNFLDRFWQ